MEREGGLWLLSDPDNDVAAADAIYRIGLHVPLGETDNSWLRTLLLDTPHQELDGFGDALITAGERRRELMAAWVAMGESLNRRPRSAARALQPARLADGLRRLHSAD